MSKHDRAKQEKAERNLIYSLKFAPLECDNCKHKSSVKGRCNICGGRMRRKGTKW